MGSPKHFDLYIKKNIFSVFLLAGMIGLCFYFSQITIENSLDDFESSLTKYQDEYIEMSKDIRRTRKRFSFFMSQLNIIEKQHYQLGCTKDIFPSGLDVYYVTIEDENFDFSKTVSLIFDVTVDLKTKENSFSYDYSQDITDKNIKLDFLKDSKISDDTLTVSMVCYLLLGSKSDRKQL